MNRKLLAALLLAAMVLVAGCMGPQQGDVPEDELTNPRIDVVQGHQVVEVEGQTFVCFEPSYGEGIDCEPLNTSNNEF